MRFYYLLFITFFACAVSAEIIPPARRITWEGNVGIPGGIPVRLTVFQTIPAGASQATIQSALNACPANQTVLLSSGTYTISGALVIPSNVTLRGSGAGNTILNATGSGKAVIRFGNESQGENTGTARSITSGYNKGSTSVLLSHTSGVSVGSLLVVDQLNDATLPVNNVGTYGTITWNSRNSGARALGQTVEVTGISGNTVNFSPPLYWTYSAGLAPEAVAYGAGCQWAGLENLTIRANNTGYVTSFYMPGSKYCWVKGIETDYADGDHGQIYWSYRCEVRDSYFHDGFKHVSGGTDCSITIAAKSSGVLVENNIFYRMHTGLILNWGTSGNVIGYNFAADPFDSGSTNVMMYDYCGNHGAHPMFNLFEGNIGGQFRDDTAWGTSSHGTLFRNWATGDTLVSAPYSGRGSIQTNTTHHSTQGLRAITLDFGQSYYNIVGNIVGSAYRASHDVFRVVSPQSRNYEGTLYLFSLGYSDVSDGGGDPKGNSRPFTTGIFHGNYDFVNATQMWDSAIADRVIPASLYLPGKPAWFGNLNWPPIDPANPASAAVANLPAGFRFTTGAAPPTGPVNQPPIAVVEADTISGAVPLSVTFSSVGSSDPEGATLTYNWTFGDGTTSASANPSHTYQTASNFVAQLRISDGTNTVFANPITITAYNPGSTNIVGLVAAYGFEEGSGGSTADSSGNNNAGTLNAASWAAGKFGTGLSFNSSNAVVAVNDSPSLDLTTGMTLEAWVYPTAATGLNLIYKDNMSYFLVGSTSEAPAPGTGASFSPNALYAPTSLPLNAWSHLAATYDGAALRLYVNGTLVSSRPQTGQITPTTGALMIGGNSLVPGKNWKGRMDEVRIYNRALGPSEILSDMNTAITVRQFPQPPTNLRIAP